MRKVTWSVVAVAIISFSAAGSALALEINVPGSACTGTNVSISSTGTGAVNNSTTNSAIAYCSVPTQYEGTTRSISARVQDQSTSFGITCTLWGYDENNVRQDSTQATTSPSGTGISWVLSYATISDNTYYLTVVCVLPQKASGGQPNAILGITIDD